MDNNKPTTSNVLSSLHVKGASVTGGAGKEGYVPVLGADGTIDVSVIPTEAIIDELSVKALSHTAYIDSKATGTSNGSIAAPYKTVNAAIEAGFNNFCIETGYYGDVTVNFNRRNQSIVRFFGQNEASFGKLTLTGYIPGTVFVFNCISVTNSLIFADNTDCAVVVTGRCQVGKIQGAVSDPSLPDGSTKYVGTLEIGPMAIVDSVINVETVVYIAESSRITNSTAEIRGQTVSDAIDDLSRRIIRIPVFTATPAGVESSTYVDIEVPVGPDGKRTDIYDIHSLGKSIADAVNAIFHKNGDSPTYKDVSAEKIDADVINSAEISSPKINFVKNGDIKAVVTVSDDNFLEIA